MISYMGMAVFRGLYFGLYDSYKNIVNNSFQKCLVSYVSTVIALFGIYPFDTIRRRLMMTSGQNYKYGSSMKFIKLIYMN
jgi:solute carrier family 25 (adenine nucleotide translocator) protein 4/5/6/31